MPFIDIFNCATTDDIAFMLAITIARECWTLGLLTKSLSQCLGLLSIYDWAKDGREELCT